MHETDELPRNPLLPVRHVEPDFFVCDIFDATPKSDQASMEHPLFTLSTKPDHTAREYRHGDTFVRLEPSARGLATVHDRDVIIYALSQCMARLQRGLKVEKKLRFHPHDLMVMTNRETNGSAYKRFKDTLFRLRNTAIETNIRMGGTEILSGFGFIENYQIVRETRDGRMQLVEITLSDWLFSAIDRKGKDLLTISPEYFRLRKPLERRLYELARKHCGRSQKWHIKLENLHGKTGSQSKPKEFRRMVQAIVDDNAAHDHFPDYTIAVEDDLVVFRSRPEFTNRYLPDGEDEAFEPADVRLPDLAYETARAAAAGWDVYMLEGEWRAMLKARRSRPDNPMGSFLAYVKWYAKEHGAAR